MFPDNFGAKWQPTRVGVRCVEMGKCMVENYMLKVKLVARSFQQSFSRTCAQA